MLSRKGLIMGAAVGAAATLVILNLWGKHLEHQRTELANPPVLEALTARTAIRQPEQLPRPWLPETSSEMHDSWRLRSLDGQHKTLAEFRGKPIFLNFWNTECGPCLVELPAIERLQESFGKGEVVFLAVTPEDARQVRSFLKKTPLNVPVYLGGEEPPPDLVFNGYPTTFIFDRNGRAVFKHEGPLNWDDDNARAFLRDLASH
jgi:thiol-disulfide isomerase/thioredoxin